MTTLTDRRVWSTNPDRWVADAISGQDYDPFGMVRPNRSVSAEGYRFGFNGKEKDTEFSNESYDFGARIYDGRVARWLSVDPLVDHFPSVAAYIFSNNCPISIEDSEGERSIVKIGGHNGRSKEYPIIITMKATYILENTLTDDQKKSFRRSIAGFHRYDVDGIKLSDGKFYKIKFELGVIDMPKDAERASIEDKYSQAYSFNVTEDGKSVEKTHKLSYANFVGIDKVPTTPNKGNEFAWAEGSDISLVSENINKEKGRLPTDGTVNTNQLINDLVALAFTHEVIHNLGVHEHDENNKKSHMYPNIGFDIKQKEGNYFQNPPMEYSVPVRTISDQTLENLVKAAKEYKAGQDAIGKEVK